MSYCDKILIEAKEAREGLLKQLDDVQEAIYLLEGRVLEPDDKTTYYEQVVHFSRCGVQAKDIASKVSDTWTDHDVYIQISKARARGDLAPRFTGKIKKKKPPANKHTIESINASFEELVEAVVKPTKGR